MSCRSTQTLGDVGISDRVELLRDIPIYGTTFDIGGGLLIPYHEAALALLPCPRSNVVDSEPDIHLGLPIFTMIETPRRDITDG